MSTGHMPNPPDQPTTQVAASGAQTQPVTDVPAQDTEVALPLGADMARIIEEQVDVIVQRQVYHSQMMLGVSALGTDPVNARNTALIVANALRNENLAAAEHALTNLGDPQITQINDQSLPFKFNAQTAGLLEGILIDTVGKAYRDDPAREQEARLMLERFFQPANEKMQLQPKAQLLFGAPGPGPNARS